MRLGVVGFASDTGIGEVTEQILKLYLVNLGLFFQAKKAYIKAVRNDRL